MISHALMLALVLLAAGVIAIGAVVRYAQRARVAKLRRDP